MPRPGGDGMLSSELVRDQATCLRILAKTVWCRNIATRLSCWHIAQLDEVKNPTHPATTGLWTRFGDRVLTPAHALAFSGRHMGGRDIAGTSLPYFTHLSRGSRITRSVDIQLNEQISLRRDPGMLSQPRIVGWMNALGVIEAHG